MAGNGVASNLIWELSRESWSRIEAILMNEGTRISTAAGKTPNGAGHRDDVVLVKDPYYILAPSPLDDERNRVLKHGETFAVLDHYGDVRPAGMGGDPSLAPR